MTRLDADLDRFVSDLRDRLEAGARTYGGISFQRPIAELVGEVMAEAVDICGWSFLAWVRLDRLRRAVEQLEQKGGNARG
jgi:hypothetical protein